MKTPLPALAALCLPLCLSALAPRPACGQELLDQLGELLTVSAFRDQVRAKLGGLSDTEAYYFERPAPGLADTTNRALFNPRLSLFLDVQVGPSVYAFAQARLDRGFDPSDHGAQLRLDEYALRYTPWEDGRLSVQVGKAAAVFGTWTGRHLSWDNPFVNPPLPYDNTTAAADQEVVENRRELGRFDAEEKYEYLPVVWSAAYTTGLTISGRRGKFDYAAEIKNAALSSRPESWDATRIGFDHPSLNARLAYRPSLAWTLGLSAGEGAYLRPEARPDLPSGRGIGDYRQYVLGQDVSFAVGRWQVWAEAMESRFELPRFGNLDTFSYYVEARYKFTPQLFGALRWNQQATADIPGQAASRDSRRVDVAGTYRFTEHMQIKLQYSFLDGDEISGEGSTAAAQFTVRF